MGAGRTDQEGEALVIVANACHVMAELLSQMAEEPSASTVRLFGLALQLAASIWSNSSRS